MSPTIASVPWETKNTSGEKCWSRDYGGTEKQSAPLFFHPPLSNLFWPDIWTLCTYSFFNHYHTTSASQLSSYLLLWPASMSQGTFHHWSLWKQPESNNSCSTNELLMTLWGSLVPINVSSWVWLNGSPGCFHQWHQARVRASTAAKKNTKLVNQIAETPIYPKFSTTIRILKHPSFKPFWT
jgi:hypothetical protein